MTQSATGLGISDDESKSVHRKSSSDRGKENIDPNEVTAPMTRSMAAAAATAQDQKEVKMTEKEDFRSPLGDLNPAEYYAEGFDATSVVLVHDDEEAETDAEGEDTKEHHDFTFQPPTVTSTSTAKVIEALQGPSLAEVLSSATPILPCNANVPDSATALVYPLPNGDDQRLHADADGDVDIEIWESESAKDESENVELPGSPGSLIGDVNVFALQEL